MKVYKSKEKVGADQEKEHPTVWILQDGEHFHVVVPEEPLVLLAREG